MANESHQQDKLTRSPTPELAQVLNEERELLESLRSLWLFFSFSLGLFMLILPLVLAISQSKLMQISDFVSAFYVAGRMVQEGHATQLYPSAQATSLADTHFNAFAHQLLPHLPGKTIAVFMYSPLLAWIFQPISLLSPQTAMILWQQLSILAVVGSAHLIASATGKKFTNFFFPALIFFPICQTILIGHIGIVFGLLPLCAGYFLLLKNRPFASGFVWSLLILKPQFLPTALLVAASSALAGQWKCAIGLMSGLTLVALLTVYCLNTEVALAWIRSLKLADTIFSDPSYGYPTYLVSSLPAMLTQLCPYHMRNAVKLLTYLFSAGIGIHALWVSKQLIKSNAQHYKLVMPYVLILAVFILPLVLPHYLFYDLSIFAIVGMMVFGHSWSAGGRQLRSYCLLGWLLLNCYFVLFMFVPRNLVQPVLLVAFLTELYRRVLLLSKEAPHILAAEYADGSCDKQHRDTTS